MRPHRLVPLASVLLFALSGCDLMSDMDGPRPEDFATQSDASEVRSSQQVDDDADTDSPQEAVGSPFEAARSGVSLSVEAQIAATAR